MQNVNSRIVWSSTKDFVHQRTNDAVIVLLFLFSFVVVCMEVVESKSVVVPIFLSAVVHTGRLFNVHMCWFPSMATQLIPLTFETKGILNS